MGEGSNFRTSYYTEVDVEVSLTAAEMAEEGWVYVGTDGEISNETACSVVHRWHDRVHQGPWTFCHEEPCKDLQ